MADKHFTLDIVTPRRLLYTGEVESLSAPGVMGNFQVLVNHAPMLAQIGIGELRLRESEGREMRYATSGGFVDVRANHVIVLAETAEPASDIDSGRAASARDRALKAMEEKLSEQERRNRKDALERALNRLRIAGK